MAELNSTVVHGKLSTTGKIYEMGQALDNKFASSIGISNRYLYLSDTDGNNLGGVNIPSGSISYSNTAITSLTEGSVSNSKYPFTGSIQLSPTVQPGYMTNNEVNRPTITVSYEINQSKLTYVYDNDGHSVTEPTITNSRKPQPGTNLIITAGYYPNDRTIEIDKANVEGEIASGSTGTLFASHSISDSNSIISSSTISGGYTFTISGSAGVSRPGWVTGSDTATQSAITYYIAKGSITNGASIPSGSSSSDTISCGTVIKIAKGYYNTDKYYTAQTSAAGASGTYTVTSLPTGDGTNIAGYKFVKVQEGSASGITGGTLSGGTPSVIGKDITGSNVTLGDADNGISVTMEAKARRAAVTRAAASYTVSEGWISSAGAGLSADSTTLGQTDSAKSTLTKYISAITVPSGKTLTTLTNNGTISTLAGTGIFTNNTGSQTIKHSSSNNTGSVTINYYASSGASESSVQVVSGGKLKTTSLPSGLSSTPNANISNPTIKLNGAGSAYEILSAAPDSGTYLSINVSSKTISGEISTGSKINAGWLNEVPASTTLGTFSTTANGYTKYIRLPAAAISIGGDYQSLGTGTAVATPAGSAPSSGYYINVKYRPNYTVNSDGVGWVTAGLVNGNVSSKWYIVQTGVISTSSMSGNNLSVTLSKSGSFTNATNMTNYGITSGSAPSTGTDGTNFLTLNLSGDNPSTTVSASLSVDTEGYVTQSDVSNSSGSKTISASLSGGTSYYIPIVTPAFTGGGVSSSISSWSQSNVTLSDTNNGISVTATPRASRTAVTWNGAKKGLINIANGATASSAVGNTNGTAGTKYISAITVPSSKTLSTVANNGTITTVTNTGTMNITSNTGTVNYRTWTINETSGGNLTFVYNG